METFEGASGLGTDVGTGDFGFVARPDDDGIADPAGGHSCHAFGAAHTQTGGIDTSVEFVWVKPFRWTFAAALDDIDCPVRHLQTTLSCGNCHDLVDIHVGAKDE